MSLTAFYVDQIMRPSFLPNLGAATERARQPMAETKRRDVLNCLRTAAKPVTATWVMDYTGYTKQSVMHLLYKLQDEALAKRTDKPDFCQKPGVSFVYWEATQ